MDTTYHTRRPITPPSDRKQTVIQNDTDIPYLERQGEQTALNDVPYLNKEKGNMSELPPASTAPSAPSRTAAAFSPSGDSANPFLSHTEPQNKSLLSDMPIDSTIPTTRKLHDQAEDTDHLNKKQSPYRAADDSTRTHLGSSMRNDTTHRIETEVLSILQWKNPIRSGAIFALVVGSIIMTRWYSLLQIASSLLTLSTGINWIYVNLVLQSQKVLTNQDASHPYNDVIHNDKQSMIDRRSVRHYSTVMTEVSETVIRALTRIVFIENSTTSAKWMAIFFVIWKVSAHVSTMDIVLAVVISAFVFPRLYISNKDVVDAQLHKGQTLLQNGFNQAQNAASNVVHDTYSKSRAFVAKAGTTGTDAKNTMSNTSVVTKED